LWHFLSGIRNATFILPLFSFIIIYAVVVRFSNNGLVFDRMLAMAGIKAFNVGHYYW
jgi:hypothetical protein